MASTGEAAVWRSGRLQTVVGLAAASGLAACSAAFYLASLPPTWFGDADWYVTPWPAIIGDAPLYPPEWLGDHVAARPPQFNLPPAAAVVAPLAMLGRGPWGMLMASCLVAALALVWPRVEGNRGLYLVCGVAALWPVWAALAWSNLNSLVLLLFAVAWRWPRQAGWAIGAAAAIKVAPIFVLAVLVGRRQWRQLGEALVVGGGLTMLASAIIDWRAPWHFLLVQLHESHPDGTWRYSASDVIPEPWPMLLAAALAIVAAARGGSWWFAVVASLVAVPTLHHHYLVWLLVPALGALRSRADRRYGDGLLDIERSEANGDLSRHLSEVRT